MSELIGKKLLILGGNAISADIVNAARRMGVYTIVTDWYNADKSPAKLIADEAWNISTNDYDLLVEKIKKEKVQGIITGFSDSYLKSYTELCKRTGLPCYGTDKQFALTYNKQLFKEGCQSYGITTIPQYSAETLYTNRRLLEENLPILFKPVDNSGSRGIIKCSHCSEIDASYRRSLEFSEKREVLIEKFMDCDDVSSAYTIRNGEIHLSIVCDRYFKQLENGGSTTSGLIYPSKYTARYIKEVDPLIRDMLKGFGFRNGVLFLQTFVDDHFYFYEMGYRLSGGRHYIATKHQNNVSALDMLISFALTGDMGEEIKNENPNFNRKYCVLHVMADSKKIASISGFDSISQWNNIIDCTLFYKEGDTVGAQGTSAQIVARIHLYADTDKEIICILDKIHKVISIKDENGLDMIQDFFM